MNAPTMSILLVSTVALGTSALAKPAGQAQPVQHLNRALAAVAAAASPPGLANPKVDRDQGDDHANAGAILRVCSTTTPAAHRSAICPVGISPD